MIFTKLYRYFHPDPPLWRPHRRFHLFSFIFTFAILCWANVDFESAADNIRYLTLWGAFSVNFYFALALLISLHPRNTLKSKKKQVQDNVQVDINESKIDQYEIQANLLFAIALVIQFPITLMYWAYLFPIIGSQNLPLDLALHGGCMILIVIEFLRSANRLYKRYIFLILMFAVLYLIVNMLFTFLERRSVYSGVGFRTLFAYIIILGMLLLIGLWFLVVYCLNKRLIRGIEPQQSNHQFQPVQIQSNHQFQPVSVKDDRNLQIQDP